MLIGVSVCKEFLSYLLEAELVQRRLPLQHCAVVVYHHDLHYWVANPDNPHQTDKDRSQDSQQFRVSVGLDDPLEAFYSLDYEHLPFCEMALDIGEVDGSREVGDQSDDPQDGEMGFDLKYVGEVTREERVDQFVEIVSPIDES